MKITKNIGILALAIALLFPTSCSEEFLEQTDLRSASEETLFQKPQDGEKLVISIYDAFHNVDFTLKALWYQANFLTQDFKNYGADVFFETYEVPTDFDALNVFWERSYVGIARANAALPIIEKMLEDEVISVEKRNQLRGEALFLRGVFYYYMASNFGGVPLELETVTDDGRHPRNTQEEVFSAVKDDMMAAAELLRWPEEIPDEEVGRATKGAALAYLGDAQMWLGQYCEAVDSYSALEGHYELEENFINIHEYNNQNGKESIFEIQYIEGEVMGWDAANDTHWITTFGMPWEVSQFGYAYANPELYNSFEEGDERKLATVIGPGDEHPSPNINIAEYFRVQELFDGINTLGTPEDPWMGDDNGRSGYYGVKNWRDPNAVGNSGPVEPAPIFSGQNLIFMRYGQVLLSKAEALYKCNNEEAARDIINNQIRARAGLEPVIGGDFMDVLLQEYRHELAGEFSLWFLLRRSGEHIRYVKDVYGINVPPGKDLMPIPAKHIGINQELEQNPGY